MVSVSTLVSQIVPVPSVLNRPSSLRRENGQHVNICGSKDSSTFIDNLEYSYESLSGVSGGAHRECFSS